MTAMPLQDRAYWIYSPAYESENSVAARLKFNAEKAIPDMIMEIFCIKLKTLKNMN